MIPLPPCQHAGPPLVPGRRVCLCPKVRSTEAGVSILSCGPCKYKDDDKPKVKLRLNLDQLVKRNASVRRCKERKAAGLPCEEFPVKSKLAWAYGITTVAKRQRMLEQTITSLAAAGFDRPHIFADDYVYTGPLPSTSRSLNLRTFGNWILGLAELYIREPRADRYVMFQDDVVACKNLRMYLERWYPSDGYLNLILYPKNKRDGQRGWYKPPYKGQGAQGLVFSRDVMLKLLYSKYLQERPSVAGPRAWKYIDGGIEGAMKSQNYFEYVHYPSLLGHVGDTSTIGNSPQPYIQHSETYDPCSAT